MKNRATEATPPSRPSKPTPAFSRSAWRWHQVGLLPFRYRVTADEIVVTDYMYYDSIYTERYMNVPSANPGGYVSAAVNNVTGFGGVDLLLAHGSGDDNVHFLNTATLLDKLTQSHTRGWQFRMFTDS